MMDHKLIRTALSMMQGHVKEIIDEVTCFHNETLLNMLIRDLSWKMECGEFRNPNDIHGLSYRTLGRRH
jgi:hypothetical protein